MLDLVAWHDFWLFVGGAAATLAGLVFVAISLRPAEILSSEHAAFLARAAFFQFFAIIGMCAILLVPWEAPTQAGYFVIGLGILALASNVRTLAKLREGVTPAIWRSVVAPFVARLLLVTSGVLLVMDRAIALYLLAAAGTILFMTGGEIVWHLVVLDRAPRAPQH